MWYKMVMTRWTTNFQKHLSKGELIELIDELKTELEMKKQISKAHQKLNGKLRQKIKQQDKDAKEMLNYP